MQTFSQWKLLLCHHWIPLYSQQNFWILRQERHYTVPQPQPGEDSDFHRTRTDLWDISRAMYLTWWERDKRRVIGAMIDMTEGMSRRANAGCTSLISLSFSTSNSLMKSWMCSPDISNCVLTLTHEIRMMSQSLTNKTCHLLIGTVKLKVGGTVNSISWFSVNLLGVCRSTFKMYNTMSCNYCTVLNNTWMNCELPRKVGQY